MQNHNTFSLLNDWNIPSPLMSTIADKQYLAELKERILFWHEPVYVVSFW